MLAYADVKRVEKKVNGLLLDAPYLGRIKNKTQYEMALALVDVLIQNFENNQPMIEMLSASISKWENSAPEFAEFNQRLAELDDVDVLKCLMEQNQLSINDFENEIGSPSLVSKILNRRDRHLTKKHISALCQRFCVSPAVFFNT